ncbi:HEPN domain-containing protein [Tangfeifania diversioriginum]|uniref:HEPN domain-containing protein n=1 Tax=Tangfeifania diversioriginum TaxID=1168035 RepID=A0A1M6J7Z4_9BACT|nr:HEPN domain-containing protein [Tangfeifania diversioriginum]SHJ42791.1 HEPN domain-containing protein [Tangfeifania diversioriginum]
MTRANNQIVAAWIEKGDHDLGSAKVIFQYIPEYFDTVAFHCQQAVEKYLKALLIFHEIEFPRTHDLPFLLELLSRKMDVDSNQFDKAIVLNGFAVEIRYPNLTIKLSKEELHEAIEIAEYFRIFTEQQIKTQ